MRNPDRLLLELEEDVPYSPNTRLASTSKERPRGVPNRLRILAIDVPEFREVFDGECRVDLSKIYPDGVAPSKVIKRKMEKKDATDKKGGGKDTTAAVTEVDDLHVMQKSLARSLVRCRHKTSKHIGVDLLEASVYDLNPHNMRRTYQFGTFSYDPGKYTGGRSRKNNRQPPSADLLQRRRTVNTLQRQRRSVVATSSKTEAKGKEKDDKGYADPEEEMEEQSHGEEMMSTEEITSSQSVKDGVAARYDGPTQGEENQVLATEEDEVDAPWNQYAWIEEMNIRVRAYSRYE